jgi:DNA-binding response OmpR family regulator
MTDIALRNRRRLAPAAHRAIDPAVLLVVLTGRTTEDAANEARDAGATIVLAKPFELSDLIGIVKTVRDRADAGGAQDAERAAGLLVR